MNIKMSSLVVSGIASLSALVIGVRLYNVFFSWGSYNDMLKKNIPSTSSSILNGKTIIVTGANSGIGKETTRELYKHGARVIMACRNQHETNKVIQEFQNMFPNSTGQLVFKYLDLTLLESVKTFALEIIEKESNLNVLINNAAVFGAPIQSTNNEFELNMQVNHIAPALLTNLLLPKLQLTDHQNLDSGLGRNRIIFVTSTLYKSGVINFELLSKISNAKIVELQKANQTGKNVYASTKLANLLFALELSKKNQLVKNVNICLASPGFTFTNLHRYTSKTKLITMSLFLPLFAMILKSSKQGAQTIIGCAMADNVRSNVLYHNCKVDENHLKNKIINNSNISEKVYNITMKSIEEYL